ncbi:phosphofructokinase family protein, partial [Chlamydia psittaci 06-1683]
LFLFLKALSNSSLRLTTLLKKSKESLKMRINFLLYPVNLKNY